MSTTRAYVRVSSQRQAAEGLSLDAQVDRLRAAAPEGDFVCYREEGVSGRKTSRPALDRLLSDIQRGDTVMVIALDRLGRSLTHVIETVRLIGEQGGQFVSLREAIDTSSSTGKFLFAVVGAFGELESDLIAERVRATRPAAIRKHGRCFGGLRPPGRNKDGSVRGQEAQVVREIAERFLAGVPVRAIARELTSAGVPTANGGAWRGPSITRMLKRPDLCGLVEIEGELAPGSLEPILTREKWDRVQALFASRATGINTRGRHPVAPYLLDGHLEVRCGVCGGRIRGGRLNAGS
jgi:site-specific DNA recombinase